MKAILVEGDALIWGEAPEPKIAADEVLIDVRASAVNRADLMQRAGLYPPPPGASEVMGLECAGVIAQVGAEVMDWQPGDEVCALLSGGGYAERVAVPAGQVLPIPDGLSFTEAAALPEVYTTAYLNIYLEALAQPGEKVLLHAGASGVGTAAIQLCSLFDNPCFVTAGGADKIEYCKKLGALGGCDRHKTQDFTQDVLDWSDGQGVAVILDPVGASYLKANQKCLAVDGRLVLIGLLGGVSEEVNLGLMLVQRQRLIGSTLRSRSTAEKSRIVAAVKERVWPHISNGSLRPIIDSVIPIENTETAHRTLQDNATIGKLILELS